MSRVSRAALVSLSFALAFSGAPRFAAGARRPSKAAPTRMEKLGRVLALEDTRSLGGGELERYLRDPDRSLRRRAALAAGRIADPAIVPVLVELMNDQEPEVRQMTAFALGLVGDRLAVDRLRASLKDADSAVRARSAEALGGIGDKRAAADVAAFVLAAVPPGAPLVTVRGDDPGSLSDPWVEMRLGLFALARLKDAGAAESVLLASGRPRFDWWAATWTAMRLELPSLAPVLRTAVQSSDPYSRALAARGLAALKDASAFDALSALARDADESVAAAALKAFGVLGDPRGSAVAASLLASKSPNLRREALRALAVLPGQASLRARIVPFVGDKEPSVRGAALRALARTDRDEFALVLSGLDPDPDFTVRADLATALGDVGGEVGASLLLGMLKDPDPRVLPAVLAAIRVARGADALDTLRRHLDHADPAVRAAAAEGLLDLKVDGLGEALGAAYERSKADPDPDARLTLLDALAGQKDAAARASLRGALTSDPARVVRAHARSLLQAAGETDLPPVGPEALRPATDYRLAMEPYEAVPGRAVYSPRAIVHTRRGKIEILLDVVETPLTTRSFVDLAERGFFDGLRFHRVEPGFVVQGGCPRGDGNGGPGYTLRSEISERPYGRGSVGMALSGKDTGGSQFFITLSPQPHLDGGYTLFGRVTAGLEVVDQIRPGDVIEHVEIWTGHP
jgi:cyclophilin family peptidyl-prolyl cis-trans isomerase/HEAT repeat protein